MLLYLLVACNMGYRKDAASGECIGCPKGTYSDTYDAPSCTPCPEGQTSYKARNRYANGCLSRKYIFS